MPTTFAVREKVVERRYKIRFPSREALLAATATEDAALPVALTNSRRAILSVRAPDDVAEISQREDFARALARLEKTYHADVVEDIRYDPEVIQFGPDAGGDSLDEVLGRIQVPPAWTRSRGGGAAIAVVDTGINGQRPEFPPAKRRGGWAPSGMNAWEDDNGHGTMCACIAAATRADGGQFDGVAPDAGLYSCRTLFFSSELVTIYDYLADEVRRLGQPLIASNSWGMQTGTPPTTDDPDFQRALRDAQVAGVIAVFSAGNYHQLAGGGPNDCAPTSIWLHKCFDDVMTVAASRLDDDRMWHYSSRGPGQWHGARSDSQRPKPDVSAPSPPHGRILYGDSVRTLVNGWGTSGSCPQVAGLCALLASLNPALPAAGLFDIIRQTSHSLGHPANCEGHGLIDCLAAVDTIQ